MYKSNDARYSSSQQNATNEPRTSQTLFQHHNYPLQLQSTIGNQAILRMIKQQQQTGKPVIQRRPVFLNHTGKTIETKDLSQGELDQLIIELRENEDFKAADKLEEALMEGDYKNGNQLTEKYGEGASKHAAYFRMAGKVSEKQNIATFTLVPKDPASNLQPQYVTLPSDSLSMPIAGTNNKVRKTAHGHSERRVRGALDSILLERSINKEKYRISYIYTERSPCTTAKESEYFGYEQGCKDYLRSNKIKLNQDDPLPEVGYHFDTGKGTASLIHSEIQSLRQDNRWKNILQTPEERKTIRDDISFSNTGILQNANFQKQFNFFRNVSALFDVLTACMQNPTFKDVDSPETIQQLINDIWTRIDMLNVNNEKIMANKNKLLMHVQKSNTLSPTILDKFRNMEKTYFSQVAEVEDLIAKLDAAWTIRRVVTEFEDDNGDTITQINVVESIKQFTNIFFVDIEKAEEAYTNAMARRKGKEIPAYPGLTIVFSADQMKEPQPTGTQNPKGEDKYIFGKLSVPNLLFILNEMFSRKWTVDEMKELPEKLNVSFQKKMNMTIFERNLFTIVEDWAAKRVGYVTQKA